MKTYFLNTATINAKALIFILFMFKAFYNKKIENIDID